jgi:DNA-binding Lrp family transcriptional regulator
VSAVQGRVRRLAADGVIRGYTALIDPESVGLPLAVMMATTPLDPAHEYDIPERAEADVPDWFWPRPNIPGGLVIEQRLPIAVIEELRRRGHRITVTGDYVIGRVTAVGRIPGTNFIRAAADSRGR